VDRLLFYVFLLTICPWLSILAYISIFLLPGCYLHCTYGLSPWVLSSSVPQYSSSLGGVGPTSCLHFLDFVELPWLDASKMVCSWNYLDCLLGFEMQSTSFLFFFLLSTGQNRELLHPTETCVHYTRSVSYNGFARGIRIPTHTCTLMVPIPMQFPRNTQHKT